MRRMEGSLLNQHCPCVCVCVSLSFSLILSLPFSSVFTFFTFLTLLSRFLLLSLQDFENFEQKSSKMERKKNKRIWGVWSFLIVGVVLLVCREMSSKPKEQFQKKPKVADCSQTMPLAASSSTKSLYCCRGYLCCSLPLGPSRALVYLRSALRSCQRMRALPPFWLQVNM